MIMPDIPESLEAGPGAATEDGFHAALESAPLGYVMLDGEGRVLDLNENYCRLLGLATRAEGFGRHIQEWIVRSDHSRLENSIRLCRETVNKHRVEIGYRQPSCGPLTVAMNMMAVPVRGVPHVVAFCFDLSEENRTALAFPPREERCRAVVEWQTELICRYLPDTTLTFVNEACCRAFGRTRAQLEGRRFIDFIPTAARADAYAAMQRIIEGKYPSIYELEVIAPDGGVHWQQRVDIPIYDREGRLAELQGVGCDITARRLAEEDLRRTHHQIRDLASRLMRAQEVERKVIAQELHDDLSQRLAAHALALSDLRRHVPATTDVLQTRIAVLEAEAMELGDSVRLLSHQLHPAVLEHVGLPAALRSFCTEFGQRSSLKFHVDVAERCPPLSDQVSLTLYRVTQEIVRNIERHARARNIWLRLSFDKTEARLCIVDDGVGFDTTQQCGKTGLGLISLEERVRFLHGHLKIRSRPGHGTRVSVHISHQKGLS
jgi:PAS domain S-box-containing protein